MQTYLKRCGIKVLDWPGNSPDLNPIENCWHIMGKKIAEKKPSTKLALQEAIIRVWHHELGQDYIQRLISSMPDRCKSVIAARGGSTKY